MSTPLRQRPRRLRGLAIAAVPAALVGLTSAGYLTSQDAEGVDDARAVLEQWVETERAISREKRDWDLGREILVDRIELVRSEIEGLRTGITEASASIADADAKRDELVAENDRYKAVAAELEEHVAGLEAKVRDLLVRLPEPVQDKVARLSQAVPTGEEEDVELSLGIRFQNVVGILNEVNKFHGEISAFSEVRTLAGGDSAEVTAVYVGLGQAYYVTGDEAAPQAGVGVPTDEGWAWRPLEPELAPAVQDLIAILQNEQPAAFVQLPVTID